MKKKILIAVAVVMLLSMATLGLVGCSGKTTIKRGVDSNGKNTVTISGFGTLTETFADEFDGNEINTNIWNVGYGGAEDSARRGAYYRSTEEYAFVKDGKLTIRTKYLDDPEKPGWRTSWLDSTTYVKEDNPDFTGFSSKFGYYETRCIAPPCTGIWSAFWLWPDEGTGFTPDDVKGGQDGAEIDIMESAWYNPKDGSGASQLVVHIDNYRARKYIHLIPTKVKKMHTDFHTFGVLWTEDEYVYYVDGKEIGRMSWGVSQVKENLILSVEVGGTTDANGTPIPGNSWAGNPIKNDKTKVYDFVIDYVRVYQK